MKKSRKSITVVQNRCSSRMSYGQDAVRRFYQQRILFRIYFGSDIVPEDPATRTLIELENHCQINCCTVLP
jgi:hypothetical protein